MSNNRSRKDILVFSLLIIIVFLLHSFRAHSQKQATLVQVVTTEERMKIELPPKGLLVYDITTESLWLYDGCDWLDQKFFNTLPGPLGPVDPYWNITGNARTDTSINFLGTTDDMPLVLKINNERFGLISTSNLFLGKLTGMKFTGPSGNIGIGDYSMSQAILDLPYNGGANIAVGHNTLEFNEGSFNIAIGDRALRNNRLAGYNTAVGQQSLEHNSSGSQNTSIGAVALVSNTTGNYNTAIGYRSLVSNNASYNTALGWASLHSNTTGQGNTGIGYYSLLTNTVNSFNTAIGHYADVGTTSTNATAVGANAKADCSNCVVLGSNSKVGIFNTSPIYPLSFGSTIGEKISFYGNAGPHYGIGVQSYLLQIFTDLSASDIAFGYGYSSSFTENMRIKGNGFVGIGTSTPSSRLHVVGNICATGTIGSCSDSRYKKDISEVPDLLPSLLSLHSIYYYWKKNEFPELQFDDKRQIGFSAQEVEGIFPELVTTDDKGYKSIDYGKMAPLLLQAIKEQQQQIDEMKKEIESMKKKTR